MYCEDQTTIQHFQKVQYYTERQKLRKKERLKWQRNQKRVKDSLNLNADAANCTRI